MNNDKVFIIAEAGVNHNGDINLAKKMIKIASKIKADAIKFQTFKTDNLVVKNAPKANYQIRQTSDTNSQYEMLKQLELSAKDHEILIKYCQKYNIEFISSPFDEESLELLKSLNVNIIKIPSGELINIPLIRKIGKLNKKIILSTGMATIDEIKIALLELEKAGTTKDNITLLHCNTSYPTPYNDVNLLAMLQLKNHFNIKVGYSDHTLGIEVPIAATALGAKVIEKHFTLNRKMPGPDHQASLTPREFEKMILSIRNIENALGNGIKQPTQSELENIKIVRKSIVAKRKIKKGEVFTEDNLTLKRPGFGISPLLWDEVVGKIAKRDFEKDEMITL